MISLFKIEIKTMYIKTMSNKNITEFSFSVHILHKTILINASFFFFFADECKPKMEIPQKLKNITVKKILVTIEC